MTDFPEREHDRADQPDARLTLGLVIRAYAGTQPDRPAILSSTFAPLSYRHLQDQVAGIGSRLRQAGLGHRARIGIALPDGPQAVLAIVAVACSTVAIP